MVAEQVMMLGLLASPILKISAKVSLSCSKMSST